MSRTPSDFGPTKMILEVSSLRSYVEFRIHPDQQVIPEWCEWRFGINRDVFGDYSFWQKVGRSEIWIAPRGNQPLVCGRLVSFGLLVMRRDPPRGTPTSTFVQRFGAHATHNIIDLSLAQLKRYVRREPIQIDKSLLSDGDCIVAHGQQIIGCGRFADGSLTNVWPKHMTAVLPNQCPTV